MRAFLARLLVWLLRGWSCHELEVVRSMEMETLATDSVSSMGSDHQPIVERFEA